MAVRAWTDRRPVERPRDDEFAEGSGFPQLEWRRAAPPELPPPARDGHSLPVFVLLGDGNGKLRVGGGIYQWTATEEWSAGWWHDGRGSVHADGDDEKYGDGEVAWWAWSPYSLRDWEAEE